MSSIQMYCRCCYSSKEVETPCTPALDILRLICDTQDPEYVNVSTLICRRCHEFLKHVYYFRTEPMNPDIKYCHMKSMLENEIDTNSSCAEIKTEAINRIDIQINKVEIKLDPEKSQQSSELIACEGNQSIDCDKPYKCDECSYTTRLLRYLNIHIRHRHCNDKPFSCNQCDYSGKIKGDLKIHKRKHLNESEKPYKCNECSYTTRVLRYLNIHITRRHCNDKPFSCDQCDYSSKIKGDLKIHKRNHLNESDKPFKCTECSFSTKTSSNLKDHTINRHTDEKPFSCDQCNYCTKTKRNLIQHKLVHLDKTNANRRFKCSECSFQTTTALVLSRHHIRKHTDEKPFKCDQCDFRAKLKYSIYCHEKSHSIKSDKKPYECSECCFKTRTSWQLKCHNKQKHCDDKPFGCDQCNFTTKTRTVLVRHKRIHLDDAIKPYVCGECGFKTTLPSTLKEHIVRKHTVGKPFLCDHCDYRGKCKHDIFKHMKTHFRNFYKNFKCTECSYKTIDTCHLNRHISRKHTAVENGHSKNQISGQIS